MPTPNASWPEILTGLVRSEGLEAEAAEWALNEIFNGRASEVQLAALLVALFGCVGSTAMAKFLLRGEVIE